MSLLLLSGLLSAVSLFAQQRKIDWSAPVRLPQGLAGPLVGVDHGVVLIAGGCNFPDSMPWAGGKKKYYNDIYVLERHGWKLLSVGHLPAPTAYGASVSTPRGVVYIGGENENGLSANVFCLRRDSVAGVLPDLPVALTNAAAAFMGKTIYVAGGETVNGVSDGLYALDLHAAGRHWERVATLPKPLSHAVFITAGQKLYLAGGRKKNPGGISDLSDAVYSYDPVARHWSVCHRLPYALSAGTGVLYDEHSLLLFGGDRGETFHQVEKLIVAVDGTGDTVKKQELLLQKARVQSSHPGFSEQILLYDMRRDEWTFAGSLPFPTPVTTTAVRWNNRIVIPGGEIRAGVRTPQILIGEINR